MTRLESVPITQALKHLIVLFSALLLLVSPCPMKASVKAFAGMPSSVESTFNKNGAAVLSLSIPTCSSVSLIALEDASNSKSDFGKVLPEKSKFLATDSNTALANSRKADHRFYRNETQWNCGVPLFLEYQKLLLPFL